MQTLSILKAVVLGFIQGATEFLPVSSSAHLVITQALLGVQIENGGLAAFDICLHFGTLISIAAVFWRELAHIITSFFKKCDSQTLRASGLTDSDARRLGIYLIIGTLPAVILGFSFKSFFEALFEKPLPAAFMLLITGAILWNTRFAKDRAIDIKTMKWTQPVLVGVAQAVAIIPGISRSGSTISGGLFLGLDKAFAARFAFLLAVPAIGGATVLELDKIKGLTNDLLTPVFAGTVVAAITGFICIKWLIGVVRRGKLSYFAYYCWTAGIAAIYYFWGK